MKTFIIAAALIVSSVSSATPATPGDVKVKALDKDGDRMISLDEAKADADLYARFNTLDTNKDKKLDAGEIDYKASGMNHGKNPKNK
ncbi:MAG: hypothetical protein H7249_19310 [Chitinophagaceae bacterium]|nr:hypothetical protein [Oligoflexus sp.]